MISPEELTMKRAFMSVLLAGLVTLPALAALKQGEQAPDFSARASLAGKEFNFSLKDALKKGPVVVYFYPSAYTGGCNLQARTFSENKDKFDAAGVSIIGVSGDSIERLHKFSSDPEYCAGKFAVASDASGTIARSYNLNKMNLKPGMKDTRGEVIEHDLIERVTFVVMPDGKIAATFSSAEDKITPAQHVEKALEAVKQFARK
jgi:peroxiredoxin